MEARKRTAPNSNMREFHAERLCEMYSRYSTGRASGVGLLAGAGVGGNAPDNRLSEWPDDSWLVLGELS